MHQGHAPEGDRAATGRGDGDMSVAEEARALFEASGIEFPEIPIDLASRLMESRDWGYTTRTDELAPYDFEGYADELEDPALQDYAILAHDGHGMNSYMMHYYLVKGTLRLLLQLPYGGVYMAEPETTDYLNDCIRLASEITREALGGRLRHPEDRLTILCSLSYGWDWTGMKNGEEYGSQGTDGPKECLEEALSMLRGSEESDVPSRR